MHSLELQLFFGFPVDDIFKSSLKKLDPQLTSLFINNNSDYLHEIVYEKRQYLGKFIGKTSTPNNLELLQKNIYSIAKKLAPSYNFISNPAVLLATTQKQDS